MWSVFLCREKCLRCNRQYNSSKGKPYCLSCFKFIKSDENYEPTYIEISYTMKKKLRKLFRWLNDIPGNWSYGCPCHFCGEKYMNSEDEKYFSIDTNYVNGHVWWFGDKKRCCTICLEHKYRKMISLNV